MDKLDLDKFKEMNPCAEGYRFVLDLKTTEIDEIFSALLEHRPKWANWLISRLLNRKNRIRYAVFAAKRSLPLFEDKHPDDKRPRLAIEAAEKCIEHDTVENRAVAKSAASASRGAAVSAKSATDAAAYATYAVARSAAVSESTSEVYEAARYAVEYATSISAMYAAYVEVDVSARYAESAAYASSDAAVSAWNVEMVEIVNYGLELLREEVE